ncbi:MAG: hypothetical protein FWD71_18130, partial [Oscillospiraceae bacterium]|nr:hypothetical protein [Oscillospiraceae bacterium]
SIKNSQKQLFVMLREPNNWVQEIIVVNDYLSPQSVKFKVTDLDTAEVLASGDVFISGNSNAVVGSVPFKRCEKRFLIIDWEIEFETGKNHYLAGHPPFSLEQYINWIDKSGMFTEWRDKTKVW